MNAQEFAYWLQGFAELSPDTPPTAEQWKSIREHLALVFKKVTAPVDLSKLRPSMPVERTPTSWPRYTVECSAVRDPAGDGDTHIIC